MSVRMSSNKYPDAGPLGHIVPFPVEAPPRCFLCCLHPPAVAEGTLWPASSPALAVCSFADDGPPDGREGVSH